MLLNTLLCAGRPLSLHNKGYLVHVSSPADNPEINNRLRPAMLSRCLVSFVSAQSPAASPEGSCWDPTWIGQWVEMKGYRVSKTFPQGCMGSHQEKNKFKGFAQPLIMPSPFILRFIGIQLVDKGPTFAFHPRQLTSLSP